MVIVVRATTGTSTASCVNLARKDVLSALPANVALHVNMKTCSSKMALVNARVFKMLMVHVEAALKDTTSTNSATHANSVVSTALSVTTGTPATLVETVLTRSKASAGVRLKIMVLVSLVCLNQPQLMIKLIHKKSQRKILTQSQKKSLTRSQKKSHFLSRKKSLFLSQKKSPSLSQKKSPTPNQKKNKSRDLVILATYMLVVSVSAPMVLTRMSSISAYLSPAKINSTSMEMNAKIAQRIVWNAKTRLVTARSAIQTT
jgi:hypothetical protein